MGVCRYCNTKAGIFKDSHEQCKNDADEALTELRNLVTRSVRNGASAEALESAMEEQRRKGRLKKEDIRTNLLKSADAAALTLAHESPVNSVDAERISDIYKCLDEHWFDDPARLVNWHGYLSLLHSNTLHQVLHGEVPYCDPSLYDVFRLGRDEHPILKRGATLAEYRTVSTGRTYQSVSLPLGNGIYYRVGASAPRSQTTGLVPIEQGTMLVSTQAIYFGGDQTTFRLPYESILRIESFSDAVGIHENHGRGKVFIPNQLGDMEEGWYFYNLISALAAQTNWQASPTSSVF